MRCALLAEPQMIAVYHQTDHYMQSIQSILELKSLLDDPETDSELRSLAVEDMESSHVTLPKNIG